MISITNTIFMIKIMFIWYLVTGVISPAEKVDGRQTYAIKKDTFAVDYAYKGEVLQWLESGKFVYNEDLED